MIFENPNDQMARQPIRIRLDVRTYFFLALK